MNSIILQMLANHAHPTSFAQCQQKTMSQSTWCVYMSVNGVKALWDGSAFSGVHAAVQQKHA